MGFLRLILICTVVYLVVAFCGSIWLAWKSYEFGIKHEVELLKDTWTGAAETKKSNLTMKIEVLCNELREENHLKVLSTDNILPSSLNTETKETNLTMEIEVLCNELREKNHSKVLSKDDISPSSLSTESNLTMKLEVLCNELREKNHSKVLSKDDISPSSLNTETKKTNLTMKLEVLCNELREKNHSKVLSKDDISPSSWSTGTKKTNLTMKIEVLRDELRKKNHSKVLSKDDFSPLSLSTGGLCGSVHLLYASLSEFLLVYHTPLRTTGNTGRHFMNMSVTVLQGNVKLWNERSEVITRPQNSTFTHRIGERMFVEIKKDTCLLVYGRGLVPLTMGYWIWDSLFSSLDPSSAAITLVYYFRAVYSSFDIGTVFSSLYDSTWALAANGVAALPEMWDSIVNWITETGANIFQSGKSIMNN